jgi:hypothetical protein
LGTSAVEEIPFLESGLTYHLSKSNHSSAVEQGLVVRKENILFFDGGEFLDYPARFSLDVLAAGELPQGTEVTAVRTAL